MRNTLVKFGSYLLIFATAVCCEDILEVPDISKETVTLLAPKNNTTVEDSQVTLSWTEVAEADAYLVQLATPNFENASQLLLDSLVVVDSTFVAPRVTKTLDNNMYEWRVRAANSGYQTEYSSGNFSVEASEN
ncbi:MAG: hypothetical protein AB3N14_13225 [Flavobacteriaceae bacterium]